MYSLLQGSFGKRGGGVTAEVGQTYILAPSCGMASFAKKRHPIKSEIMPSLLYFLLVDIMCVCVYF